VDVPPTNPGALDNMDKDKVAVSHSDCRYWISLSQLTVSLLLLLSLPHALVSATKIERRGDVGRLVPFNLS
jgi:hypothetical protein